MTLATLTAEDVRRLVLEPWCPKCKELCSPDALKYRKATKDIRCKRCDATPKSGLFTRCPKCQPEGLEWVPGKWCRAVAGVHVTMYETWEAIDLILMSIAREGTAKFESVPHSGMAPWRLTYDDLTFAVMSGDPRALVDAVAARHRLADLQDGAT